MRIFRQTTVGLGIGFGAILACMMGSIYIGFEHLDQTRGAWQRDALFREKVRAAFLLREAVRERSFHLTFATTMDDFFDRDEQRELYNSKALNFLQAREKLVELRMTPPEKVAMDILIGRVSQARPVIDAAMDLVVDGGDNESALNQMRVALDGQSAVIEEINRFITVVEAASAREAESAARDIAKTQKNMLFLSGAAVALAALIGMLVTLREARNTRRLRKHRDELAELSTTDGLTGIANRRMLDDFMEMEWSRAMRSSTPLSIILMDIDHFKNYNDSYGHGAGDDCLIQVAQAMADVIVRSTDLLARYGGEEFSCILPDTPNERADEIAEKLREAVAAKNILHEHSSAADHITISVGVATIVPRPGDDLADVFEHADANLYQAKEKGRDRVVSGPVPVAAE
ncbi:diguanylate cyclase [Magnetovibrio sp. PR-2]|uniref:GGDEF domain-containing protein n=1 Tax=Magnetovibrio sp. PR-2 TaxID=3120356 RepID=UPI002FCE28DF